MNAVARLGLFCGAILWLALPSRAGETRPLPEKSGYCSEARQMDRFVEFLKTRAPKPPDALPPLVAGISPHDDYLYTGRVYHPLFQKISAPEVVVFGVTHRKIREKLQQILKRILLPAPRHHLTLCEPTLGIEPPFTDSRPLNGDAPQWRARTPRARNSWAMAAHGRSC